jgi:uncharacterized protein
MHDAAHESTVLSAPRPTSAVAPWWHTALVLLLVVGGSILTAHPAHPAHMSGLEAHHLRRYLTGIGAEWLLFLLVWWGLRMRRVSIAEIAGFQRGPRTWGEDFAAAGIFWTIALVVLAVIGLLAQLLHLSAPQKALAAMAPRTALEMLLWIALSCSAGFVEEIAFRGYLLRQFASPAHALWLGVVGSSIVFGLAHAYEGAAGMVAIGAYGALFCGLAILRRSLRPGMIAHAWHDIFSGVVLTLLHHFRFV